MEHARQELSPAARRVLGYAEFARAPHLALAFVGRSGTVPAVWSDDEWQPVYSRRWLRIVGLIVVVALVAPAIFVALVRLGVL